MANGYEAVRAAYLKERPSYEQLCEKGAELLRAGLRDAGIRGEVTDRTKALVSYLRKMLRNPEYLSGERPIQDKAGLRVVLPYLDQSAAVDSVIESLFEIDECEETVERLGPDRLGYLAVHYIARIREQHLDPDQRTLFAGLQLEIQVGSVAQRAWAEVSHELIYKGMVEIPVAYQRIINRLLALVEVFDSEVTRAREAIAKLPGFEVVPLISELDRELLRFTARDPDRALSQRIVPSVAALYEESPDTVFDLRIGPWIAENRERLTQLYANYEADFEINPIFCQPEAFLIFERADADPTGLSASWPPEIPRELLVSLTELWGNPVS